MKIFSDLSFRCVILIFIKKSKVKKIFCFPVYLSVIVLNGKIKYKIYESYLRGRTVNNNLGPDRLAGPKALDPNHCRQPIL